MPPYIANGDRELTIRELIEEQRCRLDSGNPVERFAAAALIAGALRERLRELRDTQLGQLLEDEVCPCLNLFAPESTICDEVAERLRGSPEGDPTNRPACPRCGGATFFRFGIDEPDAWECEAASCGHRLQAPPQTTSGNPSIEEEHSSK